MKSEERMKREIQNKAMPFILVFDIFRYNNHDKASLHKYFIILFENVSYVMFFNINFLI